MAGITHGESLLKTVGSVEQGPFRLVLRTKEQGCDSRSLRLLGLSTEDRDRWEKDTLQTVGQ